MFRRTACTRGEMKGRLTVATINADRNLSGNQNTGAKINTTLAKKKILLRISFFFFRHRNSEIFSKRVIQSGCNHARPHPHHTNINLMCHSPCRDLSQGHANQHLTQSASEADGDRRRCLRRLCRYLAINGKICPTEMWRS